MPALDLSNEEIVEILAGEQLVRVAFHDGESGYLIPLGYVWLQAAFYGVLEPGRKTRIAAEHPTIVFQVDTASTTGLFEWSSVTGEGQFEIVTDQEECQRALSALQPIIAQAPDWWRSEQALRIASGALQVWKITPTRTGGRRYVPPSDAL
jgi:nitroimidazol reductase NimA-like FMN-containing flavoprotein (pyridoxamine 5'-phosphate oxidase superfamily)